MKTKGNSSNGAELKKAEPGVDLKVKSKEKKLAGKSDTGLVTSTRGYSKYLECPTETLSKQHEYKYAGILATLEEASECAGICELP